MSSDRWQRIQVLFEEALAQPRAARSAFVELACGVDRKLCAEVNTLLRAHEGKSGGEELPTVWVAPFAGVRAPGLAAGDRVAGRYVIQGLLGRGGMGEVYEAQDEELEIDVALKALRLDLGGDRRWLRSLKREVLLARAVAHPHVCRVYDVGRHGEGERAVWFLTMELLRGETLEERLRRQGRLSAAEALPLVEQMAGGLGAAHRSGVVHLDFKSGNVMLVEGEDGERAVVTDFGLARTARARMGEGEEEEEERAGLVGTPAYMAPEQVRGEEAGPAADIYALGVVLYEMVTGRLPFVGGTGLETARRRLVEEAPSPRSVVADLDERWEEVIQRCLARDPASRFRRVEEVVETLWGRVTAAAQGTPGTVTRAGHKLPAERDAFVGREVELGELGARLRSGSRLVTLLGAGGMGKTRLAVRYGWQSLGDWRGGVWFCDLTEARSVDGIASAVAGSLGVPLGKGDPMEQLGHAICGRGPCLLILDNFEQVAAQARESVGRWLERAPEGRFVATSRERLNLMGEDVQEVEPLLLESGVELFLERARRQRPRFEPRGLEVEAVREVVRLAEGMPLAIELAAARVRVMTAGQLVERMRERFRLLGGAGGGRHASLKAVIDGSWEMLQEWEKAAWAQCAVFEGGFTLEAAEGVLDLSAWPEAPWVVDVVQSLVDKSLLRTWVPEATAVGGVPEARFGMYVSLQEYAREKLKEEGAVPRGGSGPPAERAAEERHGNWYARYGTEEAVQALNQHGGVERRWRLQLEIENLVTACRRAVGRGDGETAVAVYEASFEVLDVQGPYGTAVDLGERILGEGLARVDRGRVLTALGSAERRCGRKNEARAYFEAALAIHREVGDRRSEGIVLGRGLAVMDLEEGRIEEARARFEAALAIHREVHDRRDEGIVLGGLGNVHRVQGRTEEARRYFEAALAIHRGDGNRRDEGIVLVNLGILHADLGRMENARANYEAALAIHREIGDRPTEGHVIGNLGNLHVVQGRPEEARTCYEEALAICRHLGDRRLEGVVLCNLGMLHANQDRMTEARPYYEAALAILRAVGSKRGEGITLSNLGVVDTAQGRTEEGRDHFEKALAIYGEAGDRRSEGIVLTNLGKLHLSQGQIDEARISLARGEAMLREADDWLDLGILLCIRAELERQSGDVPSARSTLAEAETLAAQVGAGPDSELGHKLGQLRQMFLSPPQPASDQ